MIIKKNTICLLALIFLFVMFTNYLINKSINIPFFEHKYTLVTISLLTLIVFNCMNNEHFKNVDEDVFTGIKGKTTMSNLQSLQNNEIQQLEEQVKFVKSFLHNKNKEIEKKKYRKIPINNSCMVLNSSGNLNLSPKNNSDNGQDLPLIRNTDLSKKDLNKITSIINSNKSN